MVQGRACGDRRQPGWKRRFAAEPRDALPRLQKRLLQEVIAVVGVPDQPSQHGAET